MLPFFPILRVIVVFALMKKDINVHINLIQYPALTLHLVQNLKNLAEPIWEKLKEPVFDKKRKEELIKNDIWSIENTR